GEPEAQASVATDDDLAELVEVVSKIEDEASPVELETGSGIPTSKVNSIVFEQGSQPSDFSSLVSTKCSGGVDSEGISGLGLREKQVDQMPQPGSSEVNATINPVMDFFEKADPILEAIGTEKVNQVHMLVDIKPPFSRAVSTPTASASAEGQIIDTAKGPGLPLSWASVVASNGAPRPE
ncbi:hypothetical protein U1Q18_009981, partial [Sarracenia purpurea var. burkii]